MKVNKKAILGMFVAIVMSLGIMGGINNQRIEKDVNIQQVAGVAGGIAASTEGFWSGFSTAVAGTAGAFGAGAGVALLVNQWHPGGWVAFGVIGGAVL